MGEHLIQRLGIHGDGVAEGPVFVPLTLPGEVVSGTVEGQRLAEVKIVTPSEERVAAPCRHFRSCGGCQLQHASDGFVADWKVAVVRDALAAHGIETAFRPIVTSPPASRRRATFAARRTKKGAIAGFHARGSDAVIEIPGCILLTPDVLGGRDNAHALALLGASRKAALAVAVTASRAGLDVAVTGGKPADVTLRQELAALCEARGLARLTWDGEVIALRAPPAQVFGPAEVVPPPGAFLQATQDGEAALVHAVREIVGDARSITDLFAGCGTFSLPLAAGARVHAVEGDAAMIAALEQGWRHAKGLQRVTGEARDLFRRPLLPDELQGADAVVIDPPRAGAEAQIAELARSGVARIAHVSCSPVTFARDAATLVRAGYALDWVQVVDQFRWSPHVEMVGAFTR
ncbi:class I SAM-dependent RNA methyltransferase [Sulfitobacter sp. D35]|uniref:class I SAM-dependent RNA methyltransferase n=1 Tax=Sulfitobacter sp. D35 TaxID=3083252 RepID=UPI00296F6237|nr:class I SAM-dependent RNA methyltransferase [Sulfitobacter sp. D35]MDW4498044.1 class I SAM-dependent RNA methyltransferase [Sulfitobacter sp. D35]